MSTSKINVGMISLSIDTLDKVIDAWRVVRNNLVGERLLTDNPELDDAMRTLNHELTAVAGLVNYFKELNKDIPIIQKTW